MVDKSNITFIKEFGLKVRKLRLEQSYSQQHYANMCDIELSQINRIELGKINTSISLAKLSAGRHVHQSLYYGFVIFSLSRAFSISFLISLPLT